MTVQHIAPGQAIIRSVETDSIIHTDMADHEYLSGAADDYTDAGRDDQGRTITEYWGTCEDGVSTWRVHVHA